MADTQSLFKSFGLSRVIIVGFLMVMLIVAGVGYGMNLPSFAGDMVRRWGMFGMLALAIVPGIRCGIGPNLGLPVGITGGMLGAVLSIEMTFRGWFDFITNPYAAELFGIFLALVVGTSLAALLGIGYGLILNRVKGSEMAVAAYVGFACVSMFNIIWVLLPIRAGHMILPATGRSLRQMINLRDDWGGIFNNFLAFDIGDMSIPTGLILVFLLSCFVMWLFLQSKTGQKMTAAGANPAYARASGISVDRMRILGTAISTAVGGFGIIIYAQSFGFLQMYDAPLMMGFTAVAAVLIGGASVKRATMFDLLFGAFIFHAILTLSLPLATEIISDVPGVPEMVRLVVTYGIILYALTKVKGATR